MTKSVTLRTFHAEPDGHGFMVVSEDGNEIRVMACGLGAEEASDLASRLSELESRLGSGAGGEAAEGGD